jgi:hypothetical protein
VAAPSLPVVAASPLVINELPADNMATLADEAGEYDDWHEVTNRGSNAIDLGAYFLGPDSEAPWRYRLPAVVLPPGGHYLVWCDGDPEQGVGHADFKHSRDGDEVRTPTDAVTPVGTAGATSTATATTPPGPPPAGRTAHLAVLASRAVGRR